MNVDLGVVDGPQRAVLVAQAEAVDVVLPADQVPAGEVATDAVYAAPRDIQAVQLVERRGGAFDESGGVAAAAVDREIADQDLAGQRVLEHARQVHSDLAHDV